MSTELDVPRVLLLANRVESAQPLIRAVRERAGRGAASFHLIVTATPRGLHRLVDPEVSGVNEARDRLERTLPSVSEAVGQPVTGSIGDANPLAAVEDALNLQGFDEIILATSPWHLSGWMRVDLPSKVRALGKPVVHVTGSAARDDDDILAEPRRDTSRRRHYRRPRSERPRGPKPALA